MDKYLSNKQLILARISFVAIGGFFLKDQTFYEEQIKLIYQSLKKDEENRFNSQKIDGFQSIA